MANCLASLKTSSSVPLYAFASLWFVFQVAVLLVQIRGPTSKSQTLLPFLQGAVAVFTPWSRSQPMPMRHTRVHSAQNCSRSWPSPSQPSKISSAEPWALSCIAATRQSPPTLHGFPCLSVQDSYCRFSVPLPRQAWILVRNEFRCPLCEGLRAATRGRSTWDHNSARRHKNLQYCPIRPTSGILSASPSQLPKTSCQAEFCF